MTRPTRPLVDFTALTLSIESRPRDEDVRDVVLSERPHLAAITQAYRARDFLDRLPGYRLRQYGEWIGEEAPAVAALIRDDVDVLSRNAVEMREDWTGPKAGLRHEPRVLLELELAVKERELDVTVLHGPTGGPEGPNAEAVGEMFRRLERRANRHPEDDRLWIGDWNCTADQLRDLADRMGGRLDRGTKVDHAIARGLKRVDTDRLHVPRGLHGFVLYHYQF